MLDVQIPDEEAELGSQDRLIHVYHFNRDSSPNHVVCASVLLLYV
jgi:ubiquitin carboxyl-terminal hydrolase 7